LLSKLDLRAGLGYMSPPDWNMMDSGKSCFGLLRRRACRVPTLRGWLVLALGMAVLVLVAVREIQPFLAVSDPLPGGVLVVEGWAPDYVLAAANAEFKRNHYAGLFVTGIPLERGIPLAEYKNYAYLATAVLIKLGLSTNEVQAVPTESIRRDRTYAMALSLKHWWREHQMAPTQVNLITTGAHARRSRLMYEKALGKGVAVGVVAIPANDYDDRHWWRSSQGVRTVLDETIAYAYAKLLFHPPEE